jgi:hypothetical protein
MWRRFSTPSIENTPPPPKNTTNNPPPAPPSTPVTATPKPAISLTQTSAKSAVPASPVKEHDLPIQRPPGAGQRRRSSIMEKLTRESTKEGMTGHMTSTNM